MGGEVDDLEELLDRLASIAVGKARNDVDRRHYARVRRLKRNSAKAAYQLLMYHEPQSLASMGRILGLSKSSRIRARDELVEKGFVVEDQDTYWVAPLTSEELKRSYDVSSIDQP